MSRVRRVILLLLVVAVGGWAFLFSLANSDSVALDLVFLQLAPAAVSVWVIGAFVAGGLCGLAAGSVAIWRARRALTQRRRAQQAPVGPARETVPASVPGAPGETVAAN
jgi:putative membrane protein